MAAIFFLLAYAWPHAAAADTLEARFSPPPGAARVAVADGSFGDFLRRLPLKPRGTAVRLYDGTPKARQDVHAAVVDLDVPPRDLQQCADAVMRLWAEYRYTLGARIAFHPDPGKSRALAFDARTHDRRAFEHWLIKLFADAGSASLEAELRAASGEVQPGDVLIQGGYPGHAVLVLDVAAGKDGRRWLLLGQSYMPAQDFHVLVNPATPSSPWYDAAALATGLKTPEWRPFTRRDVRRF
ncbi:MAG TPA: DUF4846 domain-containing protein [Polyangia bacterium]|nr:DUF4846 domain-containing protein [Polyangia bacterium]